MSSEVPQRLKPHDFEYVTDGLKAAPFKAGTNQNGNQSEFPLVLIP
jgi:hypothetical protein